MKIKLKIELKISIFLILKYIPKLLFNHKLYWESNMYE